MYPLLGGPHINEVPDVPIIKWTPLEFIVSKHDPAHSTNDTFPSYENNICESQVACCQGNILARHCFNAIFQFKSSLKKFTVQDYVVKGM
jgi:hypothetical protein